jgi:hypothetical protein
MRMPPKRKMEHWFEVQHLDIDRLLAEWRWLCPKPMRLVVRSVFADLFLADESGKIIRLDVAIGKIEVVARSETQFRELAENHENREQWFAESDEQAFSAKGLIPTETQCIAFDIPLVFADAGKPRKPYIADIHEQVSFLGDLNRQIADTPDGGKVVLKIKP